LHELKQALEDQEYKLSKGPLRPFWRNAADLEQEQRKVIALLFDCAPDLRKAYNWGEELRSIFDTELN